MVSHVTEVAKGVHRLTNGVANFYLIEELGKLVLVDAGAPKDWAVFTQAALGLGKAVGDLDAVLLTHAHTDHTGFAEHARTTLGATVWVHEHDVEMARTGKVGPRDGTTSAYLLRGAFWRTALVLGMRGATKIIPIKEVSGFSDGEVLDVPGSPRVVHAPGHTGGSAAILLEDRGILFTGDVLCTHNAYTGRAGPQIMPSGLNADTPQALASLANLTGIKADMLLPAMATHGPEASRRRSGRPGQPGPHDAALAPPMEGRLPSRVEVPRGRYPVPRVPGVTEAGRSVSPRRNASSERSPGSMLTATRAAAMAARADNPMHLGGQQLAAIDHHDLATGFARAFLVATGIVVLNLAITIAAIRVRRADLTGVHLPVTTMPAEPAQPR